MKTQLFRSSFLPFVAVVLVHASSGCAAPQAAPTGTTNACPPVEVLQGTESAGWRLGEAAFRAHRSGGDIIITATGEHRTAGYKARIVRDRTKIFPPRLLLYVKPPEGMAAQVITPFRVCVSFRAGQPIEAVTVRDSRGVHTVKVEANPPS